MTDPLSPSSSGPPTPSHSSVHIPLPTAAANPATQLSPRSPTFANGHSSAPPPPDYTNPHLPASLPGYANPSHFPHASASSPGLPPSIAPSIPASSLPGARLSGRLVNLVSLTDILNIYARASGLSPADPAESRSHRRRSSSSSLSVRKSGDIGREIFMSGRGP